MQNNQILPPENPHVLIVEDHELMRAAQVLLVQSLLPKAIVHASSSIEETKQFLSLYDYGNILLDNNLSNFPGNFTCKGIDLIPFIREKCPKTNIIFTSLDSGVGAILLKQCLVDASVPKEKLEQELKQVLRA